MKINLVTLKNNLELFILIQVSQVLNLLGYNIYQAMQYNLYTKKSGGAPFRVRLRLVLRFQEGKVIRYLLSPY